MRPPASSAEPLLLAVETATSVSSVAVLEGLALLAEVTLPRERADAEALLPAVERALARAGKREAEIEAFAISIGPGTFTGLRVGLATVKGLAFGSQRPVVPVSTLAALACGAAATRESVAALLDARRGEVYAAVYPPRGSIAPDRGPWPVEPLLREGVYTPEELAERLPRPCVLVGEGAFLHAEELRRRLGATAQLASLDEGRARALHVGQLGVCCLARGLGLPAEQVVPRYLRRAEAEAQRTGQRCEDRPEAARGAILNPRPRPLISRS